MIKKVVLSRRAKKQLQKLPQFIAEKLLGWVLAVESFGLEEIRKVPGFQDEPIKGKLQGMRSIRLSRGYRAYYVIQRDKVEFVSVEGVDKHEY